MTRAGRGRSLPALLVCLVVVLAVGALAVVLVVRPDAPGGISASAIVSAPVSEMQTADAQAATLVVTTAPAQTLSVSMPGTVTSTSCRAGESVTSGSAGLSVNDATLIYLATSRPLWRDLAVGDSGADVRSLQDALIDLGYPIGPDGRFGSATLKAVVEVAKNAGASDATTWSSLPFSRLVWLPASIVQTASCDREPGDRVSEGDPVATLPPAVSGARVSPLPQNAMPGDRVAVVGDLALPVDASGAVVSTEDLARLGQSSVYRDRLDRSVDAGHGGTGTPADGPAAPGVPIQYRLAVPVTVFSVPAAAVYDTDGRSACVVSDRHAVPVTIAGSQLGQTLVVPDGGRKLRRVGLEIEHAPACR